MRWFGRFIIKNYQGGKHNPIDQNYKGIIILYKKTWRIIIYLIIKICFRDRFFWRENTGFLDTSIQYQWVRLKCFPQTKG